MAIKYPYQYDTAKVQGSPGVAENANPYGTQVSVLGAASELMDDRGSDYGGMAQLIHTANLWSAYLNKDIQPSDVCQLMVLLKMSRAKVGNKQKMDNYVDQAAYAAHAASLASEDK